MEDDAVLLVQRADEIAELRSEHAFERALLRRDDMHLDVARAQRRRGFEADEARADHHRALGGFRLRDDGAAVGERAQRVHMAWPAPGMSSFTGSAPVASSSLSKLSLLPSPSVSVFALGDRAR